MREYMLKFLDRKNTNCVKWDLNKKRFGKQDLISLWVADMDFAAPEEVTEALRKRIEHEAYGYTFCGEEFHESYNNWLKTRFNWKLKSEWVAIMPGVVPTLVLSVLTFTKPGDKVLIQSPVYFPFFRSIESQDRTIVNSQLINENGSYKMNFDDLEKQFSTGVKMMIICSPHNPVGRVWSKEELTKLSSLCCKYKVLLVSDEIHCDLIYHPFKHYPIATISEEIAQNSITAIAPGKTFNIAGNTVSIAVIPNKEIYDKFYTSALAMGFEVVNLMGVEAFTAAYTHGEAWLEELLVTIHDNYKFSRDYLNKYIPEIIISPLEGTYLMWLDFRFLKMKNEELQNFFIQKAGLALNDGGQFGAGGEGFMRMNLATDKVILKTALHAMKKAIEGLNK